MGDVYIFRRHHTADERKKNAPVVDKKDWDETVVIGQKCCGCDATK